jgi:hypothetical protein
MSSFVRLVNKFVEEELTGSLIEDFELNIADLLDGVEYVAAWSLLIPRGTSSDAQLNLMLALAWRVNFVLQAAPERFAFHFDFVGDCLIFYIFLANLEEVASVQQAILDIRRLDSIPPSADHVAVKKMTKKGTFLGALFKLKNKQRPESQTELFRKLMGKFGIEQIWSAPGEIRLVREYWRTDIARAPDILHF